MRYVPKFNGLIDKGKLILSGEDRFNTYLSSLEGKSVEVTVQIPVKICSGRERRYYFGVVVRSISDFTGHTPEEVHEILKSMFLVVHTTIQGIGVDYVRSTTSLPTVEMEEYLSKCREWSAITLGESIPEPNEIEIGEMR